MEVNYKMIAYTLGLSDTEAKNMIKFTFFAHLGVKEAMKVNVLLSEMFESRELKQMFRHPSIELDGRDKIEYTILSLRKYCPPHLVKKIVEDMQCLKYSSIRGKYAALNYILNKEDIKRITDLLIKRRQEFLSSGGCFPRKKQGKVKESLKERKELNMKNKINKKENLSAVEESPQTNPTPLEKASGFLILR